MATGLEMMLKGFGLDPAEIKKSITGFGEVVVALKEQMDRIELQNAEILNRLPPIAAFVEVPGIIPENEANGNVAIRENDERKNIDA